MSLPIQVEQLSKKYKVYPSNRARVMEWVNPWAKKRYKEFYALHGLSFAIESGQTFGILGRNGSGKSTLLQCLAGVLTPTTGTVRVQGRVAALLELGAGFNPNFSGRDNVLINGAIQGFSHAEMKERLDKIIAFSELGEFIEQPVRTYSSGMYVRLAFSAAIQVDPDILIIDEALAVGDVRFQTKCYRQMETFRNQGKTILLVTHDNSAIMRYCDQAMLLDSGRMLGMGSAKSMVNLYAELLFSGRISHKEKSSISQTSGRPLENKVHLENSTSANNTSSVEVSEINETEEMAHIGDVSASSTLINQAMDQFIAEIVSSDKCPTRRSYNPHEHRYGDQRAQILDYLVLAKGEIDPIAVKTGEELIFLLKVQFSEAINNPIYGFTLRNHNGLEIYGSNTLFEKVPVKSRAAGDVAVIQFQLTVQLTSGDYFINLGVAETFNPSAEAVSLDRRYDLIHLQVLNPLKRPGILDFEGEIHLLKSI